MWRPPIREQKERSLRQPTIQINGALCNLPVTQLNVDQKINAVPSARIEMALASVCHTAAYQKELAVIGQYSLGQSVLINSDEGPLFVGFLSGKKVKLRKEGSRLLLEVRHSLQKLSGLPRSRVFRNKSDEDILKGLLEYAGLEADIQAVHLNRKHCQMVQFRSSDWNYMRNRLFATNTWCIPDATSRNVVIAALTTPRSKDHEFQRYGRVEDPDVYEINIVFDDSHSVDSVRLAGWDPVEQGFCGTKAAPTEAFSPWNTASKIHSLKTTDRELKLALSCLPEQSMELLAQSHVNHRQISAVQGSILLAGSCKFMCGHRITLNDFGGGLDGTAIVTGTRQWFNLAEGWRTELLLGMPGDFTDLIPKVHGFHTGIVAEYEQDPLGLDRIPIIIPAFLPEENIIFARQGKPYASKESGFFFRPEPGDEVVVAFIECDPRFPVIVGALHNQKNEHLLDPVSQTSQKMIFFKSEDATMHLTFNMEAHSVTLSDGHNSVIVGTLTRPSSESGIQLIAENVTAMSENRLQLQAANVVIAADCIDMKRKQT